MTASEVLTHGLEATFWFSLLVLLVLALRGEVAKRFGPRAAMLLWALPGLRLLAPTLRKTEIVSVPPADRLVHESQAAGVVEIAAKAEAGPVPDAPLRLAEMVPHAADAAPSAHQLIVPAIYLTEEPAAAGPEPLALADLVAAVSPDMLAAFVLSLWFAGAALACGLCLLRSREWRRTVLGEAGETPLQVTDLAARAAERAGTSKSFTLVTSDAVAAPQLLGLREPVLALPPDFSRSYTEEEQEMALLHELTHLKRFDLLLLAASEFAFSLQWFNPLTPHARRALRADQEAACDEAVRSLGVSTKSYAELLLKSARSTKPVPALTLDSHLKERIVRMQNPTQGPLKRALFITASCGAALSVAAFTASSTTHTAFVQEESERTPWEVYAEGLTDRQEDRHEDRAQEERPSALLEQIAAAQREDRKNEDRGASEVRRRILTVGGRGGRTEALVIQLGEDGSIENEEELQAFADRNGIEIDVFPGRASEPGFSFDTRGKSVEIERFTAADREEFEALRERLHEQAEEQREAARRLREEAREHREEARAFRFEFRQDDGEEEGESRTAEAWLHRFAEGGDAQELQALLSEMKVRLAFAGKGEEGNIFRFDGGDAPKARGFLRLQDSGEERGFETEGEMTGWVSQDGEDTSMILLASPFAGLEAPDFTPPTPPAPAAPKAPKVKERKTEEGTWILIPDAPDMSEFEASMEAFEERMEAWGEKMEAWGERMEERGELIEDLAEDCGEHIEETDEPTILSARIPGSRDYVRAVCASGGKERLRSSEVQDFVRKADLSPKEREAYRRTIRD
jgi:beta-lactamase regulating signal transducer with metallopeptidase domain